MIIAKMSNRSGVAGHRGGSSGPRGGRKTWRRPWAEQAKTTEESTYTLDTVAITHNVFDYEKPEHSASFEKSLKRVVDYIHREGEKVSVLITQGIESFTTPTIQMPTIPPMITDPNNPGAMIKD